MTCCTLKFFRLGSWLCCCIYYSFEAEKRREEEFPRWREPGECHNIANALQEKKCKGTANDGCEPEWKVRKARSSDHPSPCPLNKGCYHGLSEWWSPFLTCISTWPFPPGKVPGASTVLWTVKPTGTAMGTCDGAGLAQRTWPGLAGTTTEGGVWGFTGTGAGAGEGELGAWTWAGAGAWGETGGTRAATAGGWGGAGYGFWGGVVVVKGVGVVGQIFAVPGVTWGVGLIHGSPPVWFCLSLTYFSSAFKRWIKSLSSFDSHWRQYKEKKRSVSVLN